MVGKFPRPSAFGRYSQLGSASARPNWWPGFSSVWGQVSPSFTPYHNDITHMTQTQPSVRRPKGPAASASGLSGNPCALVILMRHMGHEVFERVLVHGFPGVSDGKDKAPPAPHRLGPGLGPSACALGSHRPHPRRQPQEGGEGHHHGQRSLQREDRVPESPRDIVDARRLLLVCGRALTLDSSPAHVSC